MFTIQGILTVETDVISENMVRWAEGLSREAIVLVEGTVQHPPPDQNEVKSTTIHEREIKVHKVRVSQMNGLGNPRSDIFLSSMLSRTQRTACPSK